MRDIYGIDSREPFSIERCLKKTWHHGILGDMSKNLLNQWVVGIRNTLAKGGGRVEKKRSRWPNTFKWRLYKQNGQHGHGRLMGLFLLCVIISGFLAHVLVH